MSAQGLPVPAGLQRGNHKDRDEWLASAAFILGLMARTIGRSDLGDVEVLDVGCGTKLVKMLLDEGRSIGRYVGIDVSSDVIDWLRAHVHDARFEFHQFAAQNDLYNPGGLPLREIERLPIVDRTFDLISLFSVFTHLDPDDYVSMLHLLRRYAAPDSKLLFSLFVYNEEALQAAIDAGLNSDDPDRVARTRAAIERARANPRPRFVDEVTDKPLLRAVYDRDYALELLDGTGWVVDSLNPPVPPHIQHYIVCHPS